MKIHEKICFALYLNLLGEINFFSDNFSKTLMNFVINSLNIVPIINTNDAVSPPMFIEHDETTPGSGSKKVST